ncbi:hypothetical protein B0H10DRAFT_1981568 [Mycena sp. CBHHK59/15]|nr:hypothetical protein B0H10DRAFT_2006402 [Mycena sp. CBHHK59/15]KAJ6630529.1 hypothetical protein B0H10DRAFT_1981568 [Mycena sp. CBHHK59/15]
MPLLDLSTELVVLILLALLPKHRKTLNNVCLVDRRLLSIARPLTWRVLSLEGSFCPGSSESTREARFLDFMSDEARASAVRYLEISGAWIEPEDCYEAFTMIHSIVGALPTLDSLQKR